MKLQNVHTLDQFARPLRDLRISVTDRCNLRCNYCMPAHNGPYQFLQRQLLLSFEEISRIATASVELGVNKIRLTGGEPLLRKDLPTLIELLKKKCGVEVAATTNGVLLKKLAKPLRESGLDRITVSLDAIDEALYSAISGKQISVVKALEGIGAALGAGFDSVKINCVVRKDFNLGQVIKLIEFFKDSPISIRFIEYMDAGNVNDWSLRQVVPSEVILNMIGRQYDLIPVSASYLGEVATRFRLQGLPLEIGFISSVSKPFCQDCSRMRLSSDGQIYTCLFGVKGQPIKPLLRSGACDKEIIAFLKKVWLERSDKYSADRQKSPFQRKEKVEMYQIGG